MRKLVIALAIIRVLYGVGYCGAVEVAESPHLTISLQLGVLKPDGTIAATNSLVAQIGEPIVAIMKLQNTSTNEFVVNLSELQLANLSNGLVPVIFAAERKLDCPILLPKSPMMNKPKLLTTNQSVSATIALTSYYPGLGKPGEYWVYVEYNWPHPFYFDIFSGSKKHCTPLQAKSGRARLLLEPVNIVEAKAVSLGKSTDVDIGVHLAFAVANILSDDSISVSGDFMTEWGNGVSVAFADYVKQVFPEKYDSIMRRIFYQAPASVLQKFGVAPKAD